MTTYHLFVIRGREKRPRSIGRIQFNLSPELARHQACLKINTDLLREWVQDKLVDVQDLKRWWVVECATAEEGRDLLERLQDVYRPDLPAIPAEVKSHVVLLGR